MREERRSFNNHTVLTKTFVWIIKFTGPGLIARQITARFNCVNQSADDLPTVMVVMADTYKTTSQTQIITLSEAVQVDSACLGTKIEP